MLEKPKRKQVFVEYTLYLLDSIWIQASIQIVQALHSLFCFQIVWNKILSKDFLYQ